jgi:hypothetical protein
MAEIQPTGGMTNDILESWISEGALLTDRDWTIFPYLPTGRAPRPACGERVAPPQAGSGEGPRDGSGCGGPAPHPPFGQFSPLAGRRRNRRPLGAASIVVSVARYSFDEALRRYGQRPSFPSEMSRRSWSLALLAGRGWPRRRRGRVRGLAMDPDGAAQPLMRPSGTFSPLAGRRRNRRPLGAASMPAMVAELTLAGGLDRAPPAGCNTAPAGACADRRFNGRRAPPQGGRMEGVAVQRGGADRRRVGVPGGMPGG